MFYFKNSLFIFTLSASLYCLLEIIWRGYSHISMFLLGGLCGLYLFRLATMNFNLVILALFGALGITFSELILGIILNKILKLNVWDYSSVPFNFYGQICPLYSFYWFIISFAVIFFLKKFALK